MRKHNKDQGFAVLLVIWVLVLLITLGTEFAFSMRTELNSTRNHKEDVETYYLAKAGIELARAEILQKARYHSWNPEAGYIFGQPMEPPDGTVPGGVVEEPPPQPEIVRQDLPLGGGSVTYTIHDENGKININTASRELLIAALEANGMPAGSDRDGIADSILDWIDPDDTHRAEGVESDYYRSLSPPYSAKNGPLDSLEELLKVRGMTGELLFGSPDYEPGTGASDEGPYPGLIRMFTAFNVPVFNANTANPEVLSLMYSPDQVDEILTARETNGYYNEMLSTHFRVEATGRLNDSTTRHTIVAVIEKQGADDKAILLTRYWKDNALFP